MSNVIVDLNEFEETIISEGLKLVENGFMEQNKEIRERGDNPLFTDDFLKSYVENIRLKLGIKSKNQ
jgi:ASC-1-like (ASCH) protein